MIHLILTRFNVRSSGREQSIRARPDWLAQRFDLFERFCLPSVAAQTRTDFRWLVFFDAQTPEPWRSRINGYCGGAGFTPVLVDTWTTDIVRTSVRAQLPAGETELLTTRLDNDDALHARFVEHLRAAVDRTGPGFYNFLHGLTCRDGRVYRHSNPSNPFASLLEPVEGFGTVWQVRHNRIGGTGRVHQIDLPHAWLQVVHGSNVSNRVRGVRVRAAAVREGYAALIGVTFKDDGAIERWLDSWLWRHLRAQRDRLLRLGKRWRNRWARARARTAPRPVAAVVEPEESRV